MRVDNDSEVGKRMVGLLQFAEENTPPGFMSIVRNDEQTGICLVSTSPVVTRFILDAINDLMARIAEPPAEPEAVIPN